ncbi:MAG: hypothetical protein ACRCX4_06630 [Bacteroidales bacterium]
MAVQILPQTYYSESKNNDFEYILEVKCPFCGTVLIKNTLPNANFDFESETPLLVESLCPHLLYLCDYESGFHIMSEPNLKRHLINEWGKVSPQLIESIKSKYGADYDATKVNIEEFLQHRPYSARILAEALAEDYPEANICHLDINKEVSSAGCCPGKIQFSIVTVKGIDEQ